MDMPEVRSPQRHQLRLPRKDGVEPVTTPATPRPRLRPTVVHSLADTRWDAGTPCPFRAYVMKHPEARNARAEGCGARRTKGRNDLMDQNQFDSVARSIGTPATRRSGIKALVGGLLGLGGAASVLSADAKKKGPRCGDGRCASGQWCHEDGETCYCKSNNSPACGGSCCKNNETCYLGRCQRVQGWQEGDSCKADGESCGGCCGYCNSYSACPQPNQCCGGRCIENGTSWGRQLYACAS